MFLVHAGMQQQQQLSHCQWLRAHCSAPSPAQSLAQSPSVNASKAAVSTSDANQGRRLLLSAANSRLTEWTQSLSPWQQMLSSVHGILWSHAQGRPLTWQDLQRMLDSTGTWTTGAVSWHRPLQAVSRLQTHLAVLHRTADKVFKGLLGNTVITMHRQVLQCYRGVMRILWNAIPTPGMQKSFDQLRIQAGKLSGRGGEGRQWRRLASGSDSGVDIVVTVNVPTSQNSSATESSIEGPDFAPALQQSLSSQGGVDCCLHLVWTLRTPVQVAPST